MPGSSETSIEIPLAGPQLVPLASQDQSNSCGTSWPLMDRHDSADGGVSAFELSPLAAVRDPEEARERGGRGGG